MKRYFASILAISTLLVSSGIGVNAQNGVDEAELIAKAKKIHADVITLDTHNDINSNNFTDTVNYTQDLATQVNLPKMVQNEAQNHLRLLIFLDNSNKHL